LRFLSAYSRYRSAAHPEVKEMPDADAPKPISDSVAHLLAAQASERLAGSANEGELAATASGLALLTRREREVLEGLLAGLPNQSIAYDLAISLSCEIHRAHVMHKMSARSRSELVRMSLAAGARPRQDR